VVLDTELTPELIAEGDAREIQRAIQDLRKDAGLELDDRIDVWIAPLAEAVAGHLAGVATDVLADSVTHDRPDGSEPPSTHGHLDLTNGSVDVWIRRREGG
jgi:isoleucyl-tRNA synthetase